MQYNCRHIYSDIRSHTEAQGHTTCIAGIAIAIGAGRIDIIEGTGVISGTEPPPSSIFIVSFYS